MSGLRRPIYTDIAGKLVSIAKNLEIQSRFVITVGGQNADYPTNGSNDTSQLQLAIDEANANSFGGIIIIKTNVFLFDNPALTENVGGASLKKSCIRLRDNVSIECLPNAFIIFNSGDPDTPGSITKTSAFANFGNLRNCHLKLNLDGLSDETGIDTDEHSGVYFEGRSLGGCTVENCSIDVFARNTAASAVRLRNWGVRDIVVFNSIARSCDCALQITLGAEAFVQNVDLDVSYAEGLLIAENSNVHIQNIKIKNSNREGLRITDTFRKVGCSNITIDNVFVDNAGGIAGVCIEGTRDFVIDKIISQNCQRHGVFIGRPITTARDVNNGVVNSIISKNNNQRIRTNPSSQDCGIRVFNTDLVTIKNAYAFDDQTATDAIPKLVITANSFVTTSEHEYIRTFGSNPTGSGARSFTLPQPTTANINRHITIIDDKNNASTDNITITSAGGALIDGSPSAVINTDGGAKTYRSTGTDWETAVATQFRGIFSDGAENKLLILGGASYGNLNPSIYTGSTSNALFHDGIPNRIVNNLDIRTRLNSNGDSLTIDYQDTANNKDAVSITNQAGGDGVFVNQTGTLLAGNYVKKINIATNLDNTDTGGLRISSSVNHTVNANSLAVFTQSGTTSVARLASYIDAGQGTTIFIQKNTSMLPATAVMRFDVNCVLTNNDNFGINLLSTQAHTATQSALLRVNNTNVSSINRAVSFTNGGTGVTLFVQNTNALGFAVDVLSATTTGNAVNIGVNSLTTGNGVRIASSSADTSNRNLFIVENLNALATGANLFKINNLAPSAVGFRKGIEFSGGFGGVDKLNVQFSNGINPNGVLTGEAGDIVLNGQDNQVYISQGTTNWTPITSYKSGSLVLTSSSGTLNALSGRLTTVSLTTPAGGTATLTINNSRAQTQDDIYTSIRSYTGTTGRPKIKFATATAGVMTIVIENEDAVNPLNGALEFSFLVAKNY